MKNIKVYDIEYLYLNDEDYFREYNCDNELTEPEIKEHVSELSQKSELIFQYDDYTFNEDEWNNPDYMEKVLCEILLNETQEYFSNFEWEYLVESN